MRGSALSVYLVMAILLQFAAHSHVDWFMESRPRPGHSLDSLGKPHCALRAAATAPLSTSTQ
eukprot:11994363-Alexandrium_andersonii.AAC.1